MSQTPSLPFLVKAWSFNKNRLRHTHFRHLTCLKLIIKTLGWHQMKQFCCLFFSWTVGKFLFPGLISKKNFIEMCRNFRGYKSQFLHWKTIVCSVYSKNLKHCEKRLQKILFSWSSRSQMFIKKFFSWIS